MPELCIEHADLAIGRIPDGFDLSYMSDRVFEVSESRTSIAVVGSEICEVDVAQIKYPLIRVTLLPLDHQAAGVRAGQGFSPLRSRSDGSITAD